MSVLDLAPKLGMRPTHIAADTRIVIIDVLGTQAGFHRTIDAELLGDGPGVDTLNAGDPMLLELGIQTRFSAPTAHDRAELEHNESEDLWSGGFLV